MSRGSEHSYGGAANLVIRASTARDGAALARLAELDSAPPPAGLYLLAEENGGVRAALPLEGGRIIADPFHRTADLVAMLELRAARLRPGRHGYLRRGARKHAKGWSTSACPGPAHPAL